MAQRLVEDESTRPAHSIDEAQIPVPVTTPIVTIDEATEDIVRSAEEELEELERKSVEFSRPAFHELKSKIGEYIRDLITESAREAKRHNADTISRSHVQRAGEYLVTGSGQKSARIAGSIGGILLGLGLGLLTNMISEQKFVFGITLASIALCFIGISMVAYQWAKD